MRLLFLFVILIVLAFAKKEGNKIEENYSSNNEKNLKKSLSNGNKFILINIMFFKIIIKFYSFSCHTLKFFLNKNVLFFPLSHPQLFFLFLKVLSGFPTSRNMISIKCTDFNYSYSKF